jgi:hypothetical protein
LEAYHERVKFHERLVKRKRDGIIFMRGGKGKSIHNQVSTCTRDHERAIYFTCHGGKEDLNDLVGKEGDVRERRGERRKRNVFPT